MVESVLTGIARPTLDPNKLRLLSPSLLPCQTSSGAHGLGVFAPENTQKGMRFIL